MKFLNGLLRFLATIIMIVFVLALPLGVLAHDVGQLLFQPETIKAVVKERLLDPVFVGDLARAAARNLLAGEADQPDTTDQGGEGAAMLAALDQLGEEDWAAIAALIVPEEVIGPAVDDIVDAYAIWLDSDEPLPQLNLDLQPIKANLIDHASQVAAIVMNSLPDCTLEDLANQALDSLLGEGALPLCRPPEPLYTTMLGEADQALSGILAGAPDRLDLTKVQGFEPPPELVRLKDTLQRTRLLLLWSWAVVAALGLVAVAMAARAWLQALKWAGWPTFLAGLGTLVMGLLFTGAKNSLLGGRLGRVLADTTPGGAAAFVGTAASTALDLVGSTLSWQGGAITALGLVLIVGAYAVARSQRDPLIGTTMPRD